MTFGEAIAGLAPVVGAGGLSAMAVAFFGYLAAARKGKPGMDAATAIGITSFIADEKLIRAISDSIERNSRVNEEQTDAIKELCHNLQRIGDLMALQGRRR